MAKMEPTVLAAKMKSALALLDELAEDMNADAAACSCCGLSVRENMDDFQARQAFEAAGSRVSKMYDKLIHGDWLGRSLLPVENASDARDQ
jgi:hypothetical protein